MEVTKQYINFHNFNLWNNLDYNSDCSSKLAQLNSIMDVLTNVETLLNSSFANSEESVKALASSISALVNRMINEVQNSITKQIKDCSGLSSLSGRYSKVYKG